jgi:predicted ATPase/DNA-binding SARP family transcriptional activator
LRVRHNGWVRIGILGPLDVRTDAGEPIAINGARLRALLALLALSAGKVQAQPQLIDSLWPAHPPAGAANALQALVSRLRRALPGDLVESGAGGYRLAVPPESVDAHQFEGLVVAGRELLVDDPQLAADYLRRALALWRGPVLADLAEAETAGPVIARLAELRLAAAEDLADAQLRARNGPPDTASLEAIAAEHPTRERAVHVLMQALVRVGRPADALAAYDRLRTTLAEQLGADPGRELADLHLQILRGDGAPRHVAGTTLTNLRLGLTSFVGRDDDIVRVGKLVSESRLTTLTGAGGSGKTRLAAELARSVLDELPDGAWLVELAPLGTATAVPQAILNSLGLHEQATLPRARTGPHPTPWAGWTDRLAKHLDAGKEALDRLTGALAGKDALLILDNCEHLLDAVAAISEHLLDRCPRLRILTTSREPLGLTGEALWPVEPLELPASGANAAHAATFSAIRLFADRATAAHPGFTLDDDTVGDVVTICRALDGIPLAIELAAARLRSMTLNQIACRLDDRFELLTAGSRTALPRHKTLRGVVDWSWDLLSGDEQALLRRLAYFSGGVTADAAEQLMAGSGHPSGTALDLLTTLTDKSLLVLDRSSEPRYRMLETIKAYGLDRLAKAGETEQVRRAHARYFLELAEAAEPHLRTADQLSWLELLDADYENIHSALRAAIAAGDADTSVRFVAALSGYWSLRGKRADGLQLATVALDLPGDVPDVARAVAYTSAGMCASYWPIDEEKAQAWFATGVRLANQIDKSRHPVLRLIAPMTEMMEAWTAGAWPWRVPDDVLTDRDPWVRGSALVMRAYSAFYAGTDHDQGVADLHEALLAFRQAGDRLTIAMTLATIAEVESWNGSFGVAAAHTREAVRLVAELSSVEEMTQHRILLARQLWLAGESDQARAVLDQAAREADRSGILENRIAAATLAADIARLSGEPAAARRHVSQARDLVTEARPDADHHAAVATALGLAAAAAGDLTTARAGHQEALERTAGTMDAMAISRTLVGIADYALATRRPEQAAALLGAGEAVRGRQDRSAVDADRVEAAARAALGELRFAEAYERGRLAGSRQRACELGQVTLAA